MSGSTGAPRASRVLGPEGLAALIRVLLASYRVIGPIVRDGAIVYDEITSAGELPAGWGDIQEAGTYRLIRRDDEAVFAFASSPTSWKSWLLPARVRLWRLEGDDDALAVEEDPPPERPLALFGVRSCDLHAIRIQDRVLTGGEHVDRDYAARREGAFLMVVNCSTPSRTCFCTSMGTGPRADGGHDLALTELLDGEHRFLVEVGSDVGAEVLRQVPSREAGLSDRDAAQRVSDDAAAQMGRHVETAGLPELLARNREHPRFADAAERCLTCTNCTMACPTCYCTSVEDVNDLATDSAERWRSWDSCFSTEFSYVHGGPVRRSNRAKYRQWLTHKFGTWVEQFGTSGCVGCGRCIAWCPVGIDVTEELAEIRAADGEVDSARH